MRIAGTAGLLLAWSVVLVPAGCVEKGDGGEWTRETAAVLFGGTRDGRVDLWLVEHGGDERRVVSGDLAEVGPRIAPDGVRLLFHTTDGRGGPYQLHLATPDASQPLVAEEGVYALGGVWSPDGRRIAYFSNRGLGPPGPNGFPGHVWIRDLDSGLDRRLTREPLTGTLGPSDWSADGRWILAARPFDGSLDVVRIDADTGEEERLTQGAEAEYGAAFAHDGHRIAFHAESDADAQIVVLDLATGARTTLTRGPGRRYSPVWSPDDAWLLVNAAGADEAQVDLVAIRVADGLAEPVVATPEDERYGVWVPTGSPWRRP